MTVTESPYFNFLQKTVYATSFFSLCMGMLVVFGWYSHNELLIQIQPSFVPMQFNTALGFVLCGVGLSALLLSKYNIAKILACILLSVGLGTLLQYILNYDFHIDQLFMEHFITTQSSHPGRMAPNTALCFTFISFCILVSSVRESRITLALLGSVSALVVGLGIAALIGYMFHIETAYGWGQMTRMAVHTSIGFIVLGVGFLIYACCKSKVSNGFSSEWLPISVGLIFASLTITIWQALHTSAHESLNHLEEGVLVFGMALTLLLVLLLRSGQISRMRLLNSRELNAELQGYKGKLEQLVDEKTNELKIFSSAISQAGEAITITDSEGITEYVNPAFTELTGYTLEETLGQTPRLLKSGTQDDAFYKELWETIKSGDVWQSRVVNKKKDGAFYPSLLTISSIKDDNGIIERFVGVQQDISAYESLEAEFHQAQKMEAIGTLVGGIAHDFNNSLAGITGNIYLAKKAVIDMPDTFQKLEEVEKLSFRAAEMIHQMLTFARKDLKSMNPMIVSSFLKETLKLHMISLPENIKLTYEVPDSDTQIRGDINLLQQVFMNLLNNARDAVSDVPNPAIEVKLQEYEVDRKFLSRHPEIRTKKFAFISVNDNGAGIKKRDLEHVFDPFFTTKEVGKGTGLGLAMSHGAIKSHGGVIEIESKVGLGTTFKICLPILDESQKTLIIDKQEEVIEGKGETILLVDDQDSVLTAGKKVLESLGYKLLVAANGLEAIEMHRKNGIDLTILDVVMPKMGGIDAAKEIRKINSQAHIIFATGYDRTHSLRKEDNIDSETVLTKPFTTAKLSQLIRKTMDG